MDMEYLSPSKLEQMRLCESRLAGRLNQLNEDDYEEEKGEAASVGTLAHEAANIWFRPNELWWSRMNNGGDPDAMQREAEQIITRITSGEQAFSNEEAYRTARNNADEQIAAAGLLKHPYSDPGYCFRKAIEACAASQPSAKMAPIDETPREADGLLEARQLFDQILTRYDRSKINVVFAERRYKGELKNGVPVHLIIDLGIDRGQGRLEIIDYKTGWITLATDEMYKKDQVLMNLLAVMNDPALAMYASKSFTYFWVRGGFETGPVSITPEQCLDYEHFLAVKYQRSRDLVPPPAEGEQVPPGKFVATETTNRFCNSCGRRFRCKAFRSMLGDAYGLKRPLTEEEMQLLDDEEAMSKYDTLNAQIKLLEDAKNKLAGHLIGRLRARGVQEIIGEAFKARLRQNSANIYDTPTVLQLCTVKNVDPASVVTVSKKRVEETFGTDPAAMQHLQNTMHKGMTTPFIAITQVTAKRVSGGKK
ncbi:MAG: PD-(D/E)XK nuclease family protein [Phycisphaerales bacterium]|nr:PD-(D/E)XK nuclease family protein [Phycisphaerales bacterium]